MNSQATARPAQVRGDGSADDGLVDDGLVDDGLVDEGLVDDGLAAVLAVRDELTAALVRANDQLLALYDLARLRVESLDAVEAVDRVLLEALRLVHADAAILIEGDGAAHDGPSTIRRAGTDHEAMTWLEGAARETEVRRVRAVHSAGFSGALAPLRTNGGVGTMALLGLARRSGRAFDLPDQKLIDAIAATVSGIRQLAALHRRVLDRALIEREHDTASKLAQAVLPIRPPALAGTRVFARSIPARTAGGDFFTFAAADGTLHFAVGDVAGKGLPAAIVMTKVVATTNAAFARHGPEQVATTLAEIDEELYDYLSDGGLFVTMLLGAYRPSSGVAHVCNAGHSPVMVVRRQGVETVAPSRPPLGVLPGLLGTTQRIPMAVGDLLVIGSDGLAEQEDAAGEMVGYPRLSSELAGMWRRPADIVGDAIFDLVARHVGEVSAADDRTLVVLETVS